MKKIGKIIAGIFIACAGVLELISGICEGSASTILIGINFCIIGALYLLENRKR